MIIYLAIGKAGQNVRLAVTATGLSIDIKSEQMALDEGIIFNESKIPIRTCSF